jgi:hypothetical protein
LSFGLPFNNIFHIIIIINVVFSTSLIIIFKGNLKRCATCGVVNLWLFWTMKTFKRHLDVDLNVVLGSKVQPSFHFFEKILIVYFLNQN